MLSIDLISLFKKNHPGDYDVWTFMRTSKGLNLPPPTTTSSSPNTEYRSWLLFPSSGDLPDPGIELRSPSCRQILYHCLLGHSPFLSKRLNVFPPWNLLYNFKMERTSAIINEFLSFHKEVWKHREVE